MRNSFEKWLKENLMQGILKPGDKLPSESQVIKNHKITKATFLKILNKYITLGIIISFQGRGNFVSPLWDYKKVQLRFIPIKDGSIKSVKTFLPEEDEKEMPYELQKNISKEYRASEWDCFKKQYYNEYGEIIAYSINWINKKSQYSTKFFLKNPDIAFEKIFKIKMVQTKNVTLAASMKDQQIFNNKNLSHIPTSFSYIFSNEIIPIMVRYILVRIDYFVVENRILKTKFDL